MNGQVKAIVLVVVVLLISAIVSFVSVVALAGRGDEIFPGVSVSGVNIGDKTKEEASDALTQYTEALKNKVIIVSFKGGTGQFKLSAIDLQANTASMVNKAWMAGRRGSFLEQWKERKNIAKNGLQIPFEFSVSKDKLKTVLDDISKGVRVPPRDAKIVITPEETIQIVESSNGKGVDINDAYRQILGIVKEGEKPEIILTFVEIIPAVTTEDIQKMNVNGVVADFTTYFDTKKTNRTFNVKVAASAIDGQIVKAGEAFSFNKIVGPRSEEAGYKEAKVIINNEFVDSLGGGVCQVSSTLYNALLEADVTILERSPHSLVVKYVPLGQDAAVAFGSKDLQFKNNLSSAIIMKSFIKGNALTVKLYGDVSLKKSITVINNVVKVYPFKIVYKSDPTLPKGKQVVDQNGENGYRVVSKVVIYQNGKLIGEKPLSPSYYKPLDQVILVGTKPVSYGSTKVNKFYGSKPGASSPVIAVPQQGGSKPVNGNLKPGSGSPKPGSDSPKPGNGGSQTGDTADLPDGAGHPIPSEDAYQYDPDSVYSE